MIDLVCSVCGGKNWTDVQHSVDDRWPVARCLDHHDRTQIWTPLISAGSFAKRSRIHKAEAPIDLFGSLPDENQRSLTKPIQLKAAGWHKYGKD